MRNGDPPPPLTGRLLAGKMAEWLDQLDSRTKAGILGKKEGIELLNFFGGTEFIQFHVALAFYCTVHQDELKIRD